MREKRAAKVRSGMLLAKPQAAHRAAQLPSNRAFTFSKAECTHTHVYNLNPTNPRKVIYKVKFRLKCISAAMVELLASLVQIQHAPAERRC